MPGRGDSDPLCKPEDYSFLLYTTLVGMLISHLEYGRKIGHASEFYSHLTTSLFGWLSGKPTSDEVLRRMNELVGELGYQRNVDIVGTSMGGIIGMMFASIPGAPLRRLVINDVGPTIPGLALERMKHYVGDNPLFNNVSELECYLRRVHNGFVLNDEQWATMARNSMRVLPNGKLELNYDSRIISALSRGGFSPFPGQIPDSHLLWPFFLAIDCPMLLLRGKDSDVLPLDIAQDMLKRRPNCRMNEYPGGHAPCLVDATQIADIERFLTAK
jgi:pimeloyl-ACP methyl ester carboxylesterase